MWFTYSQLLPCHSVLEYQCQASPFGKRAVGNGGGGWLRGWWTVLGLTFYSVPSIPNLLCQLSL